MKEGIINNCGGIIGVNRFDLVKLRFIVILLMDYILLENSLVLRILNEELGG